MHRNETRPSISTPWALAWLVVGSLFWVWFYAGGSFELSRLDWAKELGTFRVIESALKSGTIPFHTEYGFQGSQRFLAVPEINWFPTVLLIPSLGAGRFVLLHVLVLHAIGMGGWLRLGRQLGLGPLAWSALIVIGNWNGYIVARLGVGHGMWSGYFWLPWMFSGLAGLLRRPQDRRELAILSGAFFGMTTTGSIHLWIQGQMFVALVCAFSPRLWKAWLLQSTAALVLALWRLAPAGITFAGARDYFASGFHSLGHLMRGLLSQTPPNAAVMWGELGTIPIYWWEFTYYVGPGVALLVAGLVFAFRRSRDPHPIIAFVAAGIVLAVCSFQTVWYPVWASPIPLLNGQRAPSRFLIWLVLPLAIVGAMWLQRLLNDAGGRRRLRSGVIAVCTAIAAAAMLDYAREWRPAHLQAIFPPSHRYPMFNEGMRIIEWNEPRYEMIVVTSWCISFLAAAALLAYLIRMAGKPETPSPPGSP